MAYRFYQYEVDNGGERYEFESNGTVDWETGKEWVAAEAAEDFFHKHDGWESSWPMEIALYDGETLIGRFDVDMEQRPHFYASLVDD